MGQLSTQHTSPWIGCTWYTGDMDMEPNTDDLLDALLEEERASIIEQLRDRDR
jgi:hypothetical protein